jgi:hypothetical protein
MSSLTSKRPFILASLVIAITPLLSAATTSECAPVFMRISAPIFVPVKISNHIMLVDGMANRVGFAARTFPDWQRILFSTKSPENWAQVRAELPVLGHTDLPFVSMRARGRPLTVMIATGANQGSPSAIRAAPLGILNPPNQAPLSTAAGAGPVLPWPKVSSGSSQGSDFPNENVAMQAAPSRLSAASIGNRHVRFYGEAKNAIDHGNLLAPYYLAMHDIGGGFQARAFGAPMSPIEGENAGDRLQARFPILSVAW